jgi:hypothetical protein
VIGGAVTAPPAGVVTYVTTTAPAPAAKVTLTGNLVVGATVPEAVVLTPIPANVYAVPAGGVVYSYAIINDKKVIVDNRRAIVAIVN